MYPGALSNRNDGRSISFGAAKRDLGATIVILAIAPLIGCGSQEHLGPAAGDLPRYSVQPGQELHYTGQSSFKYDSGSFQSVSDWKVWAAHENEDGSWRLIIRHAAVHDSSDVTSDDADVTLAFLDLFPDGRFAENASFGYRFNPHALFARLPADESEVLHGWQCFAKASATDYRYSVEPPDLGASALWPFSRVEDGPMNRVYVTTRESEFTFDRIRGLVQRIHTKTTQGWGGGGSGTDRIKLKAVAMREPDWVATLDWDMQRYLEAADQHHELVDRLELAIEQAESRLDRAAELWTHVRDEVTNEVVREAVERRIRQDETWRSHRLEEAAKKAALLGQPAPAWEAADLAGNMHRLVDYAGKVVVLDFWYRGCGWCIRAMPQVNQLVEQFVDQPVAVLGMNTDSELENAKFVENTLQLKYPSLRIDKELPKTYGVSGFPTLVVVDQSGNIRDIHVGYSPRLRERIGNTIQQLLGDSASGTPPTDATSTSSANNHSLIPEPSANEPVTAAMRVEPQSVSAGDTAEILVQVRIAPAHYLYAAPQPSGPFTPLAVEIALPDGLEAVGDWQLPIPERQGNDLIYRDSIALRRSLKARSDASPQALTISGVLRYQACTEELCWPPGQLELSAPVVIRSNTR